MFASGARQRRQSEGKTTARILLRAPTNRATEDRRAESRTLADRILSPLLLKTRLLFPNNWNSNHNKRAIWSQSQYTLNALKTAISQFAGYTKSVARVLINKRGMGANASLLAEITEEE